MSRRAPLIGVSTSITVGAHPERAYVNSTYLHAVQQAGGVPVALPPQLSPASMRQLAAELDGLLLTGGGDLDPALFDETPHATLYDVAPSRDTLETAVLHVALERGRPVLAVCRGLQVLNVALGADELEVNSMHHQAIKRLGRGLTAVAWAPDQIVEGAELGDPARFVLGVQWHPEELVGHSEPARRLFAALVAAARKS